MFNKIIIVGHLTRDIDLRYTQSGSAIGKSAIATTHKFSINGEKREDTCFIDINFFGKSAEIANQYLRKGSKLLVDGRLKFEQWTDQNGQNRSKHSINVESMEMLGIKDSEPQKSNTYQVSNASQQSQVAQRKSEPQYSDVPEIESDYIAYDSQEIPF
ncbi:MULTISPECIES: single-stranded DNA-binding protein [Campylobacter]|uniref:single-stranded DNA-binding protein n=1 Tax=Campylobacter TaxID=194 RepID=UPI00027A3881|nr:MULTISPECIES: single-stranded DNA-binding protein [Campylobacter]EJP74328.1 single-stranded DNA-binding protein [Campylobacter sp. FOBRC14]